MANIKEKDMSKGYPLVICKICKQELLGTEFFEKFQKNKLSWWQNVQIKKRNQLSATGAKLAGLQYEASKRSTLLALLTLHCTRKAVRFDAKHKNVVKEMGDRLDDSAGLRDNCVMDELVVEFLTPNAD